MRLFLRIMSTVLILIALAAMHIGYAYVMPYPLVKLNVIIAVLILALLIWESGTVVWLTFFSHFILELYALTPFGIILLSSTLAMLIGYWLSKEFFTNRSLLAAMGLTASVLFTYRVIYAIILGFYHLFVVPVGMSLTIIIETALWEMLFTTASVSVIYLAAFPMLKRLDHRTSYRILQ